MPPRESVGFSSGSHWEKRTRTISAAWPSSVGPDTRGLCQTAPLSRNSSRKAGREESALRAPRPEREAALPPSQVGPDSELGTGPKHRKKALCAWNLSRRRAGCSGTGHRSLHLMVAFPPSQRSQRDPPTGPPPQGRSAAAFSPTWMRSDPESPSSPSPTHSPLGGGAAPPSAVDNRGGWGAASRPGGTGQAEEQGGWTRLGKTNRDN